MSKGLIGKKLGMTRLFIEGGKSVPVTVIEAGPATVIQVKTKDNDGYEAVKLGFGQRKHTNKPAMGQAAKAGAPAGFKVIKEFQTNGAALEVGTQVTLDIFTPGEKIVITGTSKGRGHAGVMKRHGFSGGRASHGCITHRSPGSIGCAAYPGRVVRGRKMAGHMGAEKNTVKNLVVMDVRPDLGVVLVKGAVPGPNGGLVFLKKN